MKITRNIQVNFALKMNMFLFYSAINSFLLLDAPHDSMFNINVWIQWTISRASLKAYASDKTSNESDHKKSSSKLVFAADDIVSSLDVQHEYLKWNMKVVTAGVHHYKRQYIDVQSTNCVLYFE